MRKPKIAILHSKDNLTELGPILARMGFVGLFFSDIKSLRATMQKSALDLILVDSKLTDKRPDSEGVEAVYKSISTQCPVLFAERDKNIFLFFDRQRKQALSIFKLNSYVLKHFNNYSRKCLRLTVNLPSLITQGHYSQLTRATSLSSGGAFVKTGINSPEEGKLIEMTITLIGHCAELDVSGRVKYSIMPTYKNNYMQGVGVLFEQPKDSSISLINDYLSSSLEKGPSLDFHVAERMWSSHSTLTNKKHQSVGIINKFR